MDQNNYMLCWLNPLHLVEKRALPALFTFDNRKLRIEGLNLCLCVEIISLIRMKPFSIKAMEGNPKYDSSLPILQEAGWLPFLYKFNGFDSALTRAFVKGFDAKIVNIRTTKFELTEKFIVQET